MYLCRTKTCIINAEIEVFLEKSFESDTNMDISVREKINMAAVNYHFGSKEALRFAALELIMSCNQNWYPLAEGLTEETSPEKRLRRFIRNLLRLIFPEDIESLRRSRLIWMELGNPSQDLQPLLERIMRPTKESLETIIQEILGPLDPEALRLTVLMIASQVLFPAQNRSVITTLYPNSAYRLEDVERLAEHVFLFSQAGMKGVRRKQPTEVTNQHGVHGKHRTTSATT